MSVPPQIIRVKRKKIEEPPDALYFEKGSEADHDAKRPLTEYAFKLLQEADIGYPTSQVHQNIIASPKTCDPSQDLRKESNVCRKSHQAPRVSPQGGSKVQVDEESSRNIQPRRFHLSGVTKDAESGSVLRPRGHHNKISKHSRAGAPLFTERRALSPASQQKLLQAATIETDKSQPQSGAMDIDESLQDLSVQKKPGTRDRPGPDDSISGRNTSARDPVNIDPSVLQIFSEMQEQYERELQEPSKHNGVRPLKPRLRPRIPARRRKEDHEAISKPSEIADTMDTDGPENNDYVYDTYVRYRTDQSSSQTDDLTSGNRTFGILIIDEDDQSLWEEFVDDEGDSDKDLNDDEEDENAEDFYGADYPEEEVDSDDEYDRDAYKYRYNASDDEEYDSEAGVWSDEEDLRYPWQKKGINRIDSDED